MNTAVQSIDSVKWDIIVDFCEFDPAYREERNPNTEHPFKNHGKISELAGVYAIYDGGSTNGEVLYVGRSKFLNIRFNQYTHGKGTWWSKYERDVTRNAFENPYILTAAVLFCNPSEINRIERAMIHELAPRYNVH